MSYMANAFTACSFVNPIAVILKTSGVSFAFDEDDVPFEAIDAGGGKVVLAKPAPPNE